MADHYRPGPPVGSLLLHPVALTALLVLIVNDHLLKRLAIESGHLEWLTGKLSDVAGMVVFPLLLVTGYDLCLRGVAGSPLAARPIWIRRALLATAVIASGAVFAAIQISTLAARWYEVAIGALSQVPSGVVALVSGSSAPPAGEVLHVMDPTDLIGLIGLALGYSIGARHLGIYVWWSPRR